MPGPFPVTFSAVPSAQASTARWRIEQIAGIAGESLAAAPLLRVDEGVTDPADDAVWTLRGIVSNARYTRRDERDRLAAVQAGLDRASANKALLIPIRKTEA